MSDHEDKDTLGLVKSAGGEETAAADGTPPQCEETTETLLVEGQRRVSGDLTGARLGNYHLEKLLAKGGQGAVYLARDLQLERLAAVKFLKVAGDREHQVLFEREAKAIAALSKHPHIVQIYAWGEYNGDNYFALEFVPSNVGELIKEHPQGLPEELALRLGAECAEALAYAHQRGILHRDIKPLNILLEDGAEHAKLADFGLARLGEVGHGDMTLEGIVSGSPPYMSPEQARGAPLDERSDIFSLGSTLYHMLAGRRPFDGPSQRDTLKKVLANEVTELGKVRAVDPGVAAIVARAMAPDPAERFQSAKELAVALREALKQKEATGTVSAEVVDALPRRRRRQGGLAAVLAVALVLVSAFAINQAMAPGGEVLAAANQKLDAGQYQAAEEMYRRVLRGRNMDEARYGLGYALLRQDRLDEAQAQFEEMNDGVLRGEGLAAVRLRREGHEVAEVLDRVETAYGEVLAARADYLQKDFQGVLERLANQPPGRYRFRWQEAEASETLGQAYYHLGQYEAARAALDAAGVAGPPEVGDRIDAYQRMMARREMRAAVRDQLTSIAARIEEMGGVPERTGAERWTSRPLRFIVREPGGNGNIAWETGLADVLPVWLEEALMDKTPLQALTRDELDEILQEQELQAYLGREDGGLLLQQILGGRLGIYCKFLRFEGQETMTIRLVDNETGESYQVGEIPVSRPLDRTTLLDEATQRIAAAIREHYPLQGVLTVDGQTPVINLGTAVHVDEGMAFVLTPTASNRGILKDVRAIVTNDIEHNRAVVRLEGIEADRIPPEGIYVLAEDWYEEYGRG